MNKKIFNYVFMLMVVLMGAVSFTACGSGDDNGDSTLPETTTQPSIVGSWKYTFNSGYVIYTYNANGTFSSIEYDTTGGSPTHSGSYKISSDGTSLTLTEGTKSDTYSITWINNNTFKTDIADSGSIWYRQ